MTDSFDDEAFKAAWTAFILAIDVGPEYLDRTEGDTVVPTPEDIGAVEIYANGEDYAKSIKAAIKAYNICAYLNKQDKVETDGPGRC